MQPKSWYQSRTVWLSVLTLLIAAAAAPEVLAVIPLRWLPYLTALSAVAGIVLRFLTRQPVE